jgi:SAM-dependent methyltransferase
MRATWDALAGGETEVYVGDPARAAQELESLFGRLGADPRGGTCVEVGCGPARMTPVLAARFDRVIAVDVSPAMLERARAELDARGVENAELRPVAGDRLDTVEDGVAGTLVCYLVLQHLPGREAVAGYLTEFARVLEPGGEAFVQLPLLDAGLRPLLWRAARRALVPLLARLDRSPTHDPSFRGFRLTDAELNDALGRARLEIRARGVGPDAPYRYATDVFLRLGRAA